MGHERHIRHVDSRANMTTYNSACVRARARTRKRTHTPVITEWRKVAMETALRCGQSEEKTRRRGLTSVLISAPRELLDSARMNSCNWRLTCLIRDRAASAPSLARARRDSQRETNTDPKLGASKSASNPEPDSASNVTATGKHLLQS